MNHTRRVLAVVACLNLCFFGGEILIAWWIGSVSLFADSTDFLEDATLNLLVIWGLGRTRRLQALLAFGLAVLIAAPGMAALWIAYRKWLAPSTPDPSILTVTAIGALFVNAACAFLLARIKAQASLIRAAFLSARNDVISNIAIIAAGLATAATLSPWPDVAVGVSLSILHLGAGLEVFHAARSELHLDTMGN